MTGEMPEWISEPGSDGEILLLVDGFCEWLASRQRRSVLYREVQLLLGKKLRFRKDRCSFDGQRRRVWVVPPLCEARSRWDRAIGVSPGWDGTEGWSAAAPEEEERPPF